MSDERTHPDLGEVFIEAGGRTLTVDAVEPNEPLGRQVRGYLDGDFTRRYSCTLPAWAHTWRDRKPSVDVDKMTGA